MQVHWSPNLKEIFHYHVNVVKAPKEGGDDTSGGGGRGGRGGKRRERDEGPKVLPSNICRSAIQQLATAQKWPVGLWAFDGRSNLYTPATPQLLVPRETPTWQVNV